MVPHRVAVFPRVRIKGLSPKNPMPRVLGEVWELRAALEKEWPMDAHCVAYTVPGFAKHPRINKDGLGLLGDKVPVASVFFADIDNARKASWDDALLAEAFERYAQASILETAGIYHTRSGARVVQPLTSAIAVTEFEPVWHAWLDELRRQVAEVDRQVRDWARLFRLPRVVRDGERQAHYIDLARMRAVDPPDPPVLVAVPGARASGATGRPAPIAPALAEPIRWTDGVLPAWRDRVSALAPVIARVPPGSRHAMYLALSGALATSGLLGAADLPAIVEAIARAAGDEEPDDRRRCAETTAARLLAGQQITGRTRLRQQWPEVTTALDEVCAQGRSAALYSAASKATEAASGSLEGEQVRVLDFIRRAPAGPCGVKAPPGFGKTALAIDVATERAAKPYASKDAVGVRAPMGAKTSFTAPTNTLARQIAHHDRMTVPWARHFGPTNARNDEGEFECIHREAALPVVEGGQSHAYHFCEGGGVERCERYDTCSVREGIEGEPSARIHIAPHPLASRMLAQAGTTGLLVMDEPPDPVEVTAFSMDQLADARRHIGSFASSYTAIIEPVIERLTAWAHAAPTGPVPVQLTDLLAPDIDVGALCRELRTALTDDKGRLTRVPPLTQLSSRQCRMAGLARYIGLASKLLVRLHTALVDSRPVSLWVEESRRGRVLHVLRLNESLVVALTSLDSPAVLLDANLDVNQPFYDAFLGYPMPTCVANVSDGAPIERVVLEDKEATRRAWTPEGAFVVSRRLIRGLDRAFRYATDERYPGDIGVITYSLLELALRHAAEPSNEEVVTSWRKAGQSAGTLVQVREHLGPVLAPLAGRLRFAHYGAMRGLDFMSDCDQILTLGDPRPNIAHVQAQIAFLGLYVTCRASASKPVGIRMLGHRASRCLPTPLFGASSQRSSCSALASTSRGRSA